MYAGRTVPTIALGMVSAKSIALANVTAGGQGLCVTRKFAQTTAPHSKGLVTSLPPCVCAQMHSQVIL